ncbi:MAG: hypothetical protein HC919_08705, partial [Oscillatoriales cyanobacterium SM2_2_1]|nr:hypothetical protein [Oscillatoriales cyanobacterium SM2_2_1]
MDRKQFQEWRTQSARVLSSLIPKIASATLTPEDALIDDLIRSLSNLPARPSGRFPYSGIFPPGSLSESRNRASVLLTNLIPRIPEPIGSVHDQAVDDLLRALGNLPT